MELGNHEEANEELELIDAPLRAHPDVLEVRWLIHQKVENWELCENIASALVKLVPERTTGWIHRSFALHEMKRTQEAITDAIIDYKRRTRSKNLVEPVFPPSPTPDDFRPEADTPQARALATANFLSRAWSRWLQTDEERRRRTAHPRTGKTPWIMPEAMNSPGPEPFPDAFADRLHAQAPV